MSTIDDASPLEQRTGEPELVVGGDHRIEVDTATLATVSALAWAMANVFPLLDSS